MIWTSRGLRVLSDWVDGAATPAALAIILTTDVPTWATKVQSELTEVANGNGYTTGGIAVALNSTDWPTETESDTGAQFFERRMKSQSWRASGGDIPASGSGPQAVVLVDDAGDPNVIAYLSLGSERTILQGQALTLPDLSLPIGGNLAAVPTQFEQAKADVTYGDGAKGSWVELIASTSFRANEVTIRWERTFANNPKLLDIGTGAAGSESVLIPDINIEQSPDSGMDRMRVRADIAAGTRIAARGQANGATPAVNVQVIIGGP